jgi:hypothetical protein
MFPINFIAYDYDYILLTVLVATVLIITILFIYVGTDIILYDS